MTLDNYRLVWEIDHCHPLSRSNLSNDKDMIRATNWNNLGPRYKNENFSKGSKIDHSQYLIQEIEAKHFFKSK